MNIHDATRKVNGLKKIGVGLAMLGLAVVLPACVETPSETTATETTTSDDLQTTPTESSDQLENLLGEDVIFYANFREKVGGAIFRVEESDTLDLGELLIVNYAERSFIVPEDDSVPMWVYGEVRALTAEDLESNQVAPEDFSDYEGKLAVFAEDITLAPDPALLVEEADVFYDQPVTVYGEVELVEAEDTFILRDPALFGGEGIVVILGEGVNLASLIDSEKAAVSGILRPYVIADLEQDYGLTWDLDLKERLDATYEQSAVLVADSITSVDSEAE